MKCTLGKLKLFIEVTIVSSFSALHCVKPGILQIIVSVIGVLCALDMFRYVDYACSWFPGPTLLLTSQLVRSKLGSSAMDR